MVRGTVEETLNGLLDAEADEMCRAQRYERSADRIDTRAGHYTRKLQTKAGEVEIRMPKLRRQTFETAIIERYRRREISVEEAIAYSAEDDRLFRRNVTGHSAGFAPESFLTLVGHDQSTFSGFRWGRDRTTSRPRCGPWPL
jgi:hypothetical protein